MKSRTIVGLAALLILAIPISAWGVKKSSATVSFSEPVKLAGTELKPGEYRIEWTGEGPEVQVSLLQGRQAVATAPARLLNERSLYDSPSVHMRITETGPKVVTRIAFPKHSLVFDENATGQK
ncbi:MAG TPA: hypothetical protein VNK82_03590 [Terriglobales bacterium]|nr:hypothetical protein [Terriglobales bacterium]